MNTHMLQLDRYRDASMEQVMVSLLLPFRPIRHGQPSPSLLHHGGETEEISRPNQGEDAGVDNEYTFSWSQGNEYRCGCMPMIPIQTVHPRYSSGTKAAKLPLSPYP